MSTEKQRAGFWLPPELAKAFRVKCVQESAKQSAIVEQLIRAWVEGKIRLPK